jgi:hypothetical protein
MNELDNSRFLLYSEANGRLSQEDGTFQEYGDVEKRDKPLGLKSYIDGEANEVQYSLDEIFNGLVQVRDQYCASVVATVSVLRKRPKATTPALFDQDGPSIEKVDSGVQSDPMPSAESKPRVADVCVGTEDMPFAPPKPQQAAPAERPKETPPSDISVMTTFIGMLFSSIIWVFYTVLVWVPFKIVSTTVFMFVAGLILSCIWLYVAEDQGAGAMGATLDVFYNRPGIM